MIENDDFWMTAVHKNCRKFYKRVYDLSIDIDQILPTYFAKYGELKIIHFSQFVANAKDTFEIKNSDGTEITGVIGDKSIYFVTPKNNPLSYVEFEQVLSDYIQTKKVKL